jgi:glutamate:GABA antiporter
MGGDRAQAVACADGTGPAWLGQISARFGTPVRVNILSGILATGVLVAALQISSGNDEKYFAAGLGLAISTTFVSYLATFPALVVLRRRLPDAPRPYRVPGGPVGAMVVAGVTTFLILFTVIDLIWPGFGVGWFGTSGNPGDSLPTSFAGQRTAYTLTQVIPLAFFVLVGLAFYAAGRPIRRLDAAPSGRSRQPEQVE